MAEKGVRVALIQDTKPQHFMRLSFQSIPFLYTTGIVCHSHPFLSIQASRVTSSNKVAHLVLSYPMGSSTMTPSPILMGNRRPLTVGPVDCKDGDDDASILLGMLGVSVKSSALHVTNEQVVLSLQLSHD